MKRWLLILIGLMTLSVTPAYAQTAYLSRIILDGSVIIDTGTGSPEGVVTANIGSIYMQRNGASGFVFWKKESGSGNTGWVRDPALVIGGVGTFLRSDGTNWVASVLTLPNVATANQVCYASGTNAISCGSANMTFNGTQLFVSNPAITDISDLTDAQLSLFTSGGIANLNLIKGRNTAGGPEFYFLKSRSTDGSANTVVQDGDALGSFNFNGSDGANYVAAAGFRVEVAGTPGTADMPARFVIAVSPDGSATPVDRFYVDPAGAAMSGTATPNGAAAGDIRANDAYYERGRGTPMGEWTSPAFDAGNYTANGSMTWTVDSGDVASRQYTLIGKTMTFVWEVGSTTVGGTPSTELRIALPGGVTAAGTVWSLVRVSDNGTAGVGICLTVAGSPTLFCYKDTTVSGNWAASTNATSIAGQTTFQIQ